jgi:hypothetical protein
MGREYARVLPDPYIVNTCHKAQRVTYSLGYTNDISPI